MIGFDIKGLEQDTDPSWLKLKTKFNLSQITDRFFIRKQIY
jgi:hypothetical protein